MNIVIPMAGRGSRFADIGVTVPKPLIDVFGRPMYSWAVESLPLTLATQLIFVCLSEHLEGTGLIDDIHARYSPHCPTSVIAIPDVTEGQACTVLAAREQIDNDLPLLIFNADTYFRSDLATTLPALPKSVEGVLGVFQAPGDRWSFVRLDDEGRVVETAEKTRISDWASTGLYHFTRGARFVEAADAMIAANDRVKNEFYIAPIYNRMLQEGADIRVDIAEEVGVLGTPEDLEAFKQSYQNRASHDLREGEPASRS